jgi:hypothetical protein
MSPGFYVSSPTISALERLRELSTL